MTLSSMTGFGRSNNSFENYSWVWELKSVNGKGLDLRTRIPQGFDTLDKHVKSVAKKVLFRGTLNIALHIKKDGGMRVRKSSPLPLTLFNSQTQL